MDSRFALELDDLKTRHRAMWGLGDYATVADTVIPLLGEHLVDAARINPGDRVLDIACGTGNATLPAARRGASVTGMDLSDALLAECARRAADAALAVECVAGDAEALPFPDGQFDAVISCVGAMFAPHHQVVADELLRVCRPGGTITMANWTPKGFIGQMFEALKPYAPPTPAGSQPPPLWGAEEHVSTLFGARVSDLTMMRRDYPVTAFSTGAMFRDFFKANYGPTIVVYRALADQPESAAELDDTLASLGDRHLDEAAMGWGYLMVTGRVNGLG